MCWSKPSATRITPINSRNASASIFTVGCRSMKFDTGLMNQTITATALEHGGRHERHRRPGHAGAGDRRGGEFFRLDHADGRQHRVDREHEVEQQDLADDAAEAGRYSCADVACGSCSSPSRLL